MLLAIGIFGVSDLPGAFQYTEYAHQLQWKNLPLRTGGTCKIYLPVNRLPDPMPKIHAVGENFSGTIIV
jgi:hypothetical protein